MISLLVSTPQVAVYFNDEILLSQTNVVWKDVTRAETNTFELQFLASIPATGLKTYRIKYGASFSLNHCINDIGSNNAYLL